MTRTCADCKYHKCSSNCMTIRRHCNGFCIHNRERKRCSSGQCFNYVKDEFFRLREVDNNAVHD